MKAMRDAKYFEELEKKGFHEFMHDYYNATVEYCKMLDKIWFCVQEGENTTKAHRLRARLKSIEIEKYNLQFRKRTVQMEKDE